MSLDSAFMNLVLQVLLGLQSNVTVISSVL